MIALEITGENKDIITKLLQVEKRVEILKGRLKDMAEGHKAAGRTGADAFGDMAAGVGKFALALAGVGSISAIIGKIIDETKKGIAEMRKLSADAMGKQMTMNDAVGLFLANNQSLRNGNDVQPWVKFAEEQGKKAPGVGAPKMMEQLGIARSALAGTPEADLKGAFAEAVKMSVLNPATDINQMTQAIVRIKRDMGGTTTQAANFVNSFAEMSGANISKSAGELPKLQALTALGKGNIVDAASLHGVLTSLVPDETGEKTTTLATTLMSRVATRHIDMGKGRGKGYKGPTEMDFKSENSLDRLIEVAERIGSGEFGDKAEAISAFTRSMGRESASGTMAMGALIGNLPQVKLTRDSIKAGWNTQESTSDGMLAAKQRAMGAGQAFTGMREAAGEKEAAELANTTGASMAATEKAVDDWSDASGIGSAFDPLRTGYRMVAEAKLPAAQYKREEMLRRARGAVKSRLPTSLSVSLRESFAGIRAVQAAQTPDEVFAAGALNGAIPTDQRPDVMSQTMLAKAGATPEEVAAVQAAFESGIKGAFKEALADLVGELREQNATKREGKGKTRQELD